MDYQSERCPDHFRVIMKWLMVIKDHFTKYVWLRPIPKKEGELVAAELRILFHDVGFPLIFHTDNGSEFMNETVFNLLKYTDQIILLMQGAARTPRHQGSESKLV